MFFGLFIAFVTYPVSKWFENRHFPKSVAVGICVTIVILLFLALLALLAFEVNIFLQDLSAIIGKVQAALPKVQAWLSQKFGMSVEVQATWLNQLAANGGDNLLSSVGNTFSSTIPALFMLFMTPVFAALFLYHRRKFVEGLVLMFDKEQDKKIKTILYATVHSYFRFIRGMIIVYITVGILNSIGLLMLGIEHAILFGLLAAIMTIIPYAGIIISSLLPISVALLTKDSLWYPLGVIGVFSFVQYLEANVIFPKAVGTQLHVSTWMMLVAIIVGGIVWGMAGMILFIPFVGILKVVISNVDIGDYKLFRIVDVFMDDK